MNPYLILGLILAYFILLFIISHLTARKADNNSFFIGNKISPWYVVAFGMIGTSISGVTFISVPGWVLTSKFYYMQMVLGYLLGYAAIVHILLPVYYKLNLITIYTFLEKRFGKVSYKTGASFFLISRLIGSAFRLFVVANVLQLTVFDKLNIPFVFSITFTLLFIYIYTFRGGVKTIIWTDTIQTVFLLLSVVLSIILISRSLNLNFNSLARLVSTSEYSTIFNFTDWKQGSFFFKQFLSGAFITIVMTGLDQDMMQKNLSCRNLHDAQKNVYWYSASFIMVNLLFLSLGVLLVTYAATFNIVLPERSDDLFPLLATGGYFPAILGVIFIIGLIAAAYSSADSALTALTTSFTLDIIGAGNMPELKLKRLRWIVHVGISIVMGLIIMLFRWMNNDAIINNLFIAASYTYGPLLGLFAFGLFSRIKVRDRWVPIVAIASPGIAYVLKTFMESLIEGYHSGYEILVINGLITAIGLLVISRKQPRENAEHNIYKEPGTKFN
jgi:solute:Na+ symporter, SSS family